MCMCAIDFLHLQRARTLNRGFIYRHKKATFESDLMCVSAIIMLTLQKAQTFNRDLI